MITIENRLLQFHLEHKDGRTARVLATSYDAACRAVEWFNADVKLCNLQPVDAYVLEKQPHAHEVARREMVATFKAARQ